MEEGWWVWRRKSNNAGTGAGIGGVRGADGSRKVRRHAPGSRRIPYGSGGRPPRVLARMTLPMPTRCPHLIEFGQCHLRSPFVQRPCPLPMPSPRARSMRPAPPHLDECGQCPLRPPLVQRPCPPTPPLAAFPAPSRRPHLDECRQCPLRHNDVLVLLVLERQRAESPAREG